MMPEMMAWGVQREARLASMARLRQKEERHSMRGSNKKKHWGGGREQVKILWHIHPLAAILLRLG